MPFRIAIFEDNDRLRESLVFLLNSMTEYEVVGDYNNCAEAATIARVYQPDVVLMDIGMPGLNGIEITKKIKEQFPHIRILIQTVFNESEKIFKALCAGASGYILKNDPPHKYIEAIRMCIMATHPSVLLWPNKCLLFLPTKM